MISKIRRMTYADIDAVYSIESNVHVTPWSKEVLKDCVLVGYDCRILELIDDGKSIIAGYIISRLTEDKCHILSLSIAKPLQSKGLGKRLLKELMHYLIHSTKISLAVLEVRPSNIVAISLYQSMGFEPIDIKKEYYKDKNGIEDAIILQKILNS